MRTNKIYDVSEINGGSYHHFGVSSGIQYLLLRASPDSFSVADTLVLQINIDGLPLFKSSNTQFWPILGRLVDPFRTEPFIIGLYVGYTKAGDVNTFLQHFVAEIQHLEENLLYFVETSQFFKVVISAIICDTPAKAVYTFLYIKRASVVSDFISFASHHF